MCKEYFHEWLPSPWAFLFLGAQNSLLRHYTKRTELPTREQKRRLLLVNVTILPRTFRFLKKKRAFNENFSENRIVYTFQLLNFYFICDFASPDIFSFNRVKVQYNIVNYYTIKTLSNVTPQNWWHLCCPHFIE